MQTQTHIHTVQFEIEPIVKLVCLARNCRYSLLPHAGGCNLKHIRIGPQGTCQLFELRELPARRVDDLPLELGIKE